MWLDNNANVVDEEVVIDTLENASDYERGLEALNEKQKSIVSKLKKFGNNIKQAVATAAPQAKKIAGAKCKCMLFCTAIWFLY